MIEMITAWGISKIAAYVGGSIAAFVLAWILKKIPNEKIYRVVEKFFYGLGVSMTLGLSRWKFTKRFWNSVIEPWFIDAIHNIFVSAVNGLIRGLKSDN